MERSTEPDAAFSFVWRLANCNRKALEAHQKVGMRIIVDASGLPIEEAIDRLQAPPFSGFTVDLKVPFSWFPDPRLDNLLKNPGMGTLWVEYHPVLHDLPLEVFLRRLEELDSTHPCRPVLADTRCIRELLKNQGVAVSGLAIKGFEASGFVSTESAFVLYGAMRALLRERGRRAEITIWGGIATPEACSAFLTCGARGIVFESVHWLTDLHPLGEATREALRKLHYDQTDVAGLGLGIPYRAHNRGNSIPLKALKELASQGDSKSSGTGAGHRLFTEAIRKQAVHPLDSGFTRNELIPLGVEAAFAREWTERFGTDTEKALRLFKQAVSEHHRRALENPRPFEKSPVAAELGTRYPFIQGGMSSISDVPAFALEVAKAGGLPTIALGFMDRETIHGRLGDLRRIMGDRPFALNVVALQENPFRNEQMEWIRQCRPPFVVIAAGEPSTAREMAGEGIETIYIAPTEDLLRMALAAGIRFIVLEGCEAGGHVGHHTTLTLAQMALILRRCNPELWRDRRVILAGGICNGETAYMAWMLGADAVQMGTVYLATREIVETGALTRVYQSAITQAPMGGTVITGESTGLRVRSLKTPKTDAICALEEEYSRKGTDIQEHRRKIEELCAGSLHIAARGEDKCSCTPLDDNACWERGQFMSGACSGTIRQVRTVAELHNELASGVPIRRRTDLLPGEVPSPTPVSRRNGSWQGFPERIAITGMRMVNALGNTLEEIFQASLAGKSGITLVPASRWDHGAYYHPVPMTPEKTYCRVGAFHHLEIARKDIGVPPQDFRTMTHSTKMTLWLAARAVEESGILESGIPRERIGVIVSQNSGEAASTFSDIVIGGAVEPTLKTVRRLLPLSPDQEQSLRGMLKDGHLVVDDTTLVGRLNCTAGGYISNKYGFMGPSFAVTAACSSSLVALYNAVLMIRLGIIDAAVVGGGEEPLHPLHYLEFSALGALAGISGAERLPEHTSRPFEAGRDGMVLGEGGAIIVIERESLAHERGAKIHGFITGVGASNNPYSLIESSRESQEIAIRASLAGLPYGPGEIDLIECHATSTTQGDLEEVHAIRAVFPADKPTLLSAFKSQIGHTLGSSGLNSLVRGLLAMEAGVIPPTINYDTPDPRLGLEDSRLRVVTEPEEWRRSNGRPRRMQVNSFGFGGSNFVIQIEECLETAGQSRIAIPQAAHAAAEALTPKPDVLEGISLLRIDHGEVSYRAAVLNGSPQELEEALRHLRNTLPAGGMSDKTRRSLSRQGIYVEASTNVAPPPLALVFPGQGSQYAGMGRELYHSFPIVRAWLERADRLAEFDLLSLYLEDREEQLRQTLWQQPAAYTLEYALYQQLVSLGIRPVAMAGHSLGELTALAAAGVFSFEDGFRLVTKRAQSMDKASNQRPDPGVMMATDAPLDLLRERLRQAGEVFIANINSPRQVVLGGAREAVLRFGQKLKELGYRATVLRVSMAFHCPLLPIFADEMRAFTKALHFQTPEIPVVSNTIRVPFPADPEKIKEIVVAHPESPVYWMDNVLTLWNDYGVRRFVEIGPGATLSDLIRETLEDADCIATCMPESEGTSFKQAIGELFVKGHISPAIPVEVVTLDRPAPDGAKPSPKPEAIRAMAPTPQDRLAALVQREINGFLLDTFGRFLAPSILDAVRREIDPNISPEQLDGILQTLCRRSPQTPFLSPTPLFSTPLPASQPGMETTPPPPPPVSEPVQPSPIANAPPGPSPLGPSETAEEVIGIIMEVTGYERDEIEPQMDLRTDLGIRSSRLPIIVDRLEKRFALRIRMEDFIDVRTVSQMTDRIAQLTTGGVPEATAGGEKPPSHSRTVSETVEAEKNPDELRRLVFRPVSVEMEEGSMPSLSSENTVAILPPASDSPMGKELSQWIQERFGAKVKSFPWLPTEGEESRVRRGVVGISSEGSLFNAVDTFLKEHPAEVFCIPIDGSVDRHLESAEDVCRLQEQLFLLVQAILASPPVRSILLLGDDTTPSLWREVLWDGLVGIFLAAALEYPSVRFRSVRAKEGTDFSRLLATALQTKQAPVELTVGGNGATTLGGRREPFTLPHPPNFSLSAGDVILVSGGGYGITAQLVRSLAPFGTRVVLLGRTSIDLPEQTARHLQTEEFSEKALRWDIMQMHPSIGLDDLNAQVERFHKARQVYRTVRDLRESGIDVEYTACDVSDPTQVKAAVGGVIERFGRVDGVIHGAGVLHDKYLADLDGRAFRKVVDVKVLGAWNLYEATRSAGLKFFVGLSSIVAVQGNMGQTNYASGNRMMSRLLENLSRQHAGVVFKALMLPPVSGGGMAEDPEVRDLLEHLGVGYVGMRELSEMFWREIFCGSPADVWVMWMKSLPPARTVLLEGVNLPDAPDSAPNTLCETDPRDFPMVDAIERLDLESAMVQVRRAFSLDKDPWVSQHKPFKFLKHPLVSAIMVVESFLEATRLLFPYLTVSQARDIRFMDPIEVGPDTERVARVTCSRRQEGKDMLCECTMEVYGVSPGGRRLETLAPCYRALVLATAGAPEPLDRLVSFPIPAGEFIGRPMEKQEILDWYDKRSDMQGLYRVLEHIDGYGDSIISGKMIYPQDREFSFTDAPAASYPRYALEGLMQLCSYYVVMRDESESRAMIPARVEELHWYRFCSGGEDIKLEARCRQEDERGLVWDALASGRDGRPILEARGIHMRWFAL
ncbi:MAG: SDR family NAD(P)-dependent oxidoreductase [Deltaproteobacteria bacterium]|nr:SDR family NAD(P)-dependent oxidoreductase [Deltaproteobacteria bacterium]